MANETVVVSLAKLQEYDALLKQYIDSEKTKAFKLITYNDTTRTIKFYRKYETGTPTGAADFEITLPSDVDVSALMGKVANATKGNVPILQADGTLIDGGIALSELALSNNLSQVATSGIAADVSVADVNEKILATDVEGALEEIIDKVNTNTTGVNDLVTNLNTTTQILTTSIQEVKNETDTKVKSVVADNASIYMGGTDLEPTVGVRISPKEGNSLELKTDAGEEGLYLSIDGTNYTVYATESNPGGLLKRYTLTQPTTGLEVNIDIPKDLVIQSGSLVTIGEGEVPIPGTDPEEYYPAGTYIRLVINDENADEIYIDISQIVKPASSGSKAGDEVIITVTENAEISATLVDDSISTNKIINGAITSDKLSDDVKFTVATSSDINKLFLDNQTEQGE